MRKSITIALLLSVFFILTTTALIDGFAAFADIPTVSAAGTLTSIEDDGSIIIDEKGYKVDSSVRVINRKGRSASLRSLPLPTAVRFEYIQAETGFTIVLIEEVKNKKVKNKGSQ